MPGQRRNQEHARLCRRDFLAEMQQRREWGACRSLFVDLDLTAIDGDGVDTKGRPHMGEPGTRNELVDCGEIA